jgi:hypothetical protein
MGEFVGPQIRFSRIIRNVIPQILELSLTPNQMIELTGHPKITPQS